MLFVFVWSLIYDMMYVVFKYKVVSEGSMDICFMFGIVYGWGVREGGV